MAQTDFATQSPIHHTTTVYSVYERGMSHLAMAGFFILQEN